MSTTKETLVINKQYRSCKQVYRTASYIHDRARISKIRETFTNIMKECTIFGCSKAQTLNPKYSLSTIKRRFRLWKEEEKNNIPPDQRFSTYYANSARHWNRTFTPDQEKVLADNIHAIIDAKVELVNLRVK